jgi:outer membrane protein assembly factor BamB
MDNKFVLECMDLGTGKILWKGREDRSGGAWSDQLRLRGRGTEPGFFDALVIEDEVVVHGLYDVLAFNVKDGKLRWRFRVPFNFEIKHATASGDLLMLSGASETICLHLLTHRPDGEVVWQEKEQGSHYIPPYFHGDRFVSVRKVPFNVTVRYRASGKLMGRLSLPDLSMYGAHPVVKGAPHAMPAAHDGKLLVLTDAWYYIAVDIERMNIRWKRLIDANDRSREPPMRLALGGDHLVVLKEDYDRKTVYMLDSRTGKVLWWNDPKVRGAPRPSYSNLISNGRLYGLEPHPTQGFYFVARDAATGKQLFRQEVKGYQSQPSVELLPRIYGHHMVAKVADRQNFHLVVLDIKSKGKPVRTIHMKGVGPFGVHGRVSCTAQNGHVVLLSKDKVAY